MDSTLGFACKFSKRRALQKPDYGRHLVADCGEEVLLAQLESDRGRIISSAAVRRLQQKTQVFPLERNAAVRSRLTHSLEVQQNGRFIVRTIFKLAKPHWAEHVGLHSLERALETLVEMACLLHDVGNPPFGHFGESAITDWFDANLRTLTPFDPAEPSTHPALRDKLSQDLQSFEGNAQAIRLTHRLLKLNLTYVQTAGLLKYVRPAYKPKPDKQAPLSYLHKKPGYYLSEEAFVTDLWENLNMQPGTRHPVAYIMEAADDISYCLADIEDAVEKGIFNISQLCGYLREAFEEQGFQLQDRQIESFGKQRSLDEILGYVQKCAEQEEVNKVSEFFISLRVQLVHPLVNHAARQFIDNSGAICKGTLNRALLEDGSIYSAIIQMLKSVAVRHVFNHAEVETLELQGYRIIYGLFDLYAPLLSVPASTFMALLDEQRGVPVYLLRLKRRLPAMHVAAYRQAVKECQSEADFVLWERYHRCRMLQDFISGMTDQFAHDEFKTLMVSD
ncbi:deoxyguanosinetriphosphate triphosphohydrolase [Pokkaliibacter plantistimulans]|uniref:Probable deoxyguanosinetriphosphate triphosphohydrolase n=1 Tax=Pokkaliibacter plantistimulans TaxID=1635171 RepID=A0ABX5LPR3_9GAMM|nr:dGTPase [Pokkaliibacter plantistimulans]PXF28657.1 deoxyguanosinetriphosphate triphosphohydrolase [Pokkaliibacter plantistimulans]